MPPLMGGLWDKNSGPYTCKTRPFTCWAISPALKLILLELLFGHDCGEISQTLSSFSLTQPCRMDRDDGDGTGGRIPSCNYWSGCGSSRRHQMVTWVVTREGGKVCCYLWGALLELRKGFAAQTMQPPALAFENTALYSTANPKCVFNGHWPLGRPGNHVQILTCNRFLGLNIKGSASGPDGSLGVLPCSGTGPGGRRLSSRFGRAVGVSQAGHLFSGEQAVSVCEKEEPDMLWAGPSVEVLFWILCGRRRCIVVSLSWSENNTQECTLAPFKESPLLWETYRPRKKGV